jgi:hypothetical protein
MVMKQTVVVLTLSPVLLLVSGGVAMALPSRSSTSLKRW